MRPCVPSVLQDAAWPSAAREPLWPEGVEGSISHSRLAGGVALCAVRPGQEGIGLDLEAWLDGDQGAQLWPGIMDGEEWGRLEAGFTTPS